MHTRSVSRLWAPPLVALALVLAACGGQSDTELATIDDGSETPAVVEDLGGPEGPAGTTLETVEAPVEDDEMLPVPEAQIPEAPSVASSPAARQQNQAAVVPAIDEETGRYERLPTPAEDLDDASYLAQRAPDVAESESAPRGGQFTIPVTGDAEASADGATASAQAGVSQRSPSGSFDASASDASRVGLIDPAQLEASLVQGASGVLPDPEPQSLSAEPGDDAPTPVADVGVDPATQVDLSLDGAINDLSAPGSSVAADPGSAEESGSADDVNCELRPWARGCPIPEDIFDRVDEGDPSADVPNEVGTDEERADDGGSEQSGADKNNAPQGSAEDGTADGDEGESEDSGVQVPQSVIDILLTDPDVEAVPSSDDPAVEDPAGGDAPEVVNPAGG